MHAKTANAKIAHVSREYKNRRLEFSRKHQKMLEKALNHARKYMKNSAEKFLRWEEYTITAYFMNMIPRVYSIGTAIFMLRLMKYILEDPIKFDDFKNFIRVARQSTITPVFGDSFEKLKDLIMSKNSNVPEYFRESQASLSYLRDVNAKNWLEIVREYRYSFFLEIQFRKFFTDYLLRELGDIKNIYKECPCYRENNVPSYVDNVILFDGRYLCVEIN